MGESEGERKVESEIEREWNSQLNIIFKADIWWLYIWVLSHAIPIFLP